MWQTSRKEITQSRREHFIVIVIGKVQVEQELCAKRQLLVDNAMEFWWAPVPLRARAFRKCDRWRWRHDKMDKPFFKNGCRGPIQRSQWQPILPVVERGARANNLALKLPLQCFCWSHRLLLSSFRMSGLESMSWQLIKAIDFFRSFPHRNCK